MHVNTTIPGGTPTPFRCSLTFKWLKGDNMFNLTYSSTNLFKDIINQVIKMPDEINFRNIIWDSMQDTLANHLTSFRTHI
jgi:hypothetical protein